MRLRIVSRHDTDDEQAFPSIVQLFLMLQLFR